MYSRSTLKMASSFFMFFLSIKASTSALNSINCLATTAFKTVMGLHSWLRNQQHVVQIYYRVKAKGEVRMVAIGIVQKDLRNLTNNVQFQVRFSWGQFSIGHFFQFIQSLRQLRTDKDRNDGRRGLIGSPSDGRYWHLLSMHGVVLRIH